jgi:hypothetical protein
MYKTQSMEMSHDNPAVALEILNVKNRLKHRRLSKPIADASWVNSSPGGTDCLCQWRLCKSGVINGYGL